jgi:hypothetical protein
MRCQQRIVGEPGGAGGEWEVASDATPTAHGTAVRGRSIYV